MGVADRDFAAGDGDCWFTVMNGEDRPDNYKTKKTRVIPSQSDITFTETQWFEPKQNHCIRSGVWVLFGDTQGIRPDIYVRAP